MKQQKWKLAAGILLLLLLVPVYYAWIYFHVIGYEPNADMASHLLQANAMLHGNVLLKFWWNANFAPMATDLPYYILMLAKMGPGLKTMWHAYTLAYVVPVVLLLVLLGTAKGKNRLWAFLPAVVVLFPTGTVLQASRIHFAVPAFLFMELLLTVWLYRAKKGRKLLPLLLLFAAAVCGSVSDDILLVVFDLPLIGWGVLECIRSRRFTAKGIGLAAAGAAITLASKLLQGYWKNNICIPVKESLETNYAVSPAAFIKNCRDMAVMQAEMFGMNESVFCAARILLGVCATLLAVYTVLQMLRGKKSGFLLELASVSYGALCAGLILMGSLKYRYFLAGIFLECLILGCWMKNAKPMQGHKKARALCAAVLLLACLPGIWPLQKEAIDPEKLRTVEMMQQAGVERAYATGFWYEIPLWVYSQGKVRVLTTKVSDDGINSFRWFEDSREYQKPVYAILCGQKGQTSEVISGAPEYFIERIGEPAEIYTEGEHTLLVYDWNLTKVMDKYRKSSDD